MAQTALRNLYDTLKTTLEAVLDDNSDQVVSYFSWYNQNKAGENFQAIIRDTAIFFELVNIGWQTINGVINDAYSNQEQGTCTFNLHFFRKSLKDDNLATIELIDKVNEVHRDLLILSGENFSCIQRISEQQDTVHDNVIDWVVTYKCQLYEQATEINRTAVSPSLSISKSIGYD